MGETHHIIHAHRRLRQAFLVLCLALAGCAHYPEWTLVKEKNHTSVYLRDVALNDIPQFRGEVTIEASFQDVMQTLTNFSEFNQWVYQCERVDIVEFNSYTDAYLYQVNALSFVRDRDILVHGVINFEKSDIRRATINLSSVPDYCDNKTNDTCQAIRQNNYIRVRKSEGRFQITELEDGNVEVTWEQTIDPEGWIPDWLTRLMIADIPLITLNNLKQRIEQSE